MGDPQPATPGPKTDDNIPAQPRPSSQLPATVHDLPESVFDGELHCGFAIVVTASGKPSTIMIPDASKIKEGAPVYITGRVGIQGENLKEFLKGKGVTLPKELDGLIGKTEIDCDAFYYSTQKSMTTIDGKPQEVDQGPLLMMFSIKFNQGLIGALTGDEHLGKLFDVQSGSVRVLRCPKNRRGDLEEYVKQLQTS